MNKLLLLTTMLAFCTMSAHAKPKKITECHALFTTELDGVGPSSEHSGGAEFVIDITNKSKKAIYAIEGVFFAQLKGDKGSFVSTGVKKWSEGIEKGEMGYFDLHVSPTGMTLSAIASGRFSSVNYGMHHASILYEDGEIKKCGDHNAFVIPLIPYTTIIY